MKLANLVMLGTLISLVSCGYPMLTVPKIRSSSKTQQTQAATIPACPQEVVSSVTWAAEICDEGEAAQNMSQCLVEIDMLQQQLGSVNCQMRDPDDGETLTINKASLQEFETNAQRIQSQFTTTWI